MIHDVQKISLPWNLNIELDFSEVTFVSAKRPAVNLGLTRHPTLLVKVDHAAVSLAPGAQKHSSSFSDVGLAAVGFRGADQNTDTRQQRGKQNLTLW